MGYRSQVQSVIYANKEQMDAFKNKNKELLTMLEDEFNDGSLEYKQKDDLDMIYLKGDCWKWYDDFKEVMGWHDLIDRADEDGLCTEFVRAGEEPDDVVTDYRGKPDNLQYFIYPSTIIEANF
jgi:hypothetical protein